MRKIVKYGFLGLLAAGLLGWFGGSAFIIWAVEFHSGAFPNPATCRAPFRVYALTWPIWGRVPHSVENWVLNVSFDMCPPKQ